MELIHCRNESCWLQNTGHSQREESLPDVNPSEILREGRMMESEASPEKPLQPEWHMYTGQELGQQPAHPASPRWGWTRAHSCPRHRPHCPAEAAQQREPQQCHHQVWQRLRPTLPLTAGTATPTLPARSSKSWQFHALPSAFQEKALFIYN